MDDLEDGDVTDAILRNEDILRAVSVPPAVELPVEALLALPPPTEPGELVDPTAEPGLPMISGEKLREAIQAAPEALNKLKGLSPRALTKSTVGAGIDRALEASGLRAPTPYEEPI